MENFSQNPFQPGMTQAVFSPDQLISGPLQPVTDSVTIAKSGILNRGTVLGVITATGEYVVSKKGAEDGSQIPSAILVGNVDATADSVTGGVYLMGEFNHHWVIFDESWTLPALKTQLRTFSIFLRDSEQA
ncbi:head decoration protein [Xenorhabdus bovienii]|uniref:head decoration protein n=1 Tax=Xenorhabdus bovienii TaxID=40576 RepID=UPI00237D0B98|nr:head decoration protein [Xenorhabdus bovienii]MDE1476230.1 head decoration protein [Xenorhabdus bovienii]MDE1484089.1 head decoration protein [Xenorhabdus bovienii]MDE9443351.1 head decoration protein [Xenorhabdus bovienii]MDE9496122.1 head decoration protein [Xenorhabdus bovienii]MDE9504523.1 head decoration protein [Xenorhabdus bovienii]